MKKYSRFLTIVLIALCCSPSFIHAHLRFGPLMGDNMVVQQQTDVHEERGWSGLPVIPFRTDNFPK